MIVPSWPASLPVAPQLATYSENYSSLAQAVTTGNKSLLVRRNGTRAQDKINVSFMLNRQQVEYFETFFYDTLAGGTLRFTFRHPRTRQVIDVSFDPTSDQVFTVEPQQTMEVFKVSFTLIIWS